MPVGHLGFILNAKEGALAVEPGWFQLSQPAKVEQLNRDYHVSEFAPDFPGLSTRRDKAPCVRGTSSGHELPDDVTRKKDDHCNVAVPPRHRGEGVLISKQTSLADWLRRNICITSGIGIQQIARSVNE
jgi:hypothetical protein